MPFCGWDPIFQISPTTPSPVSNDIVWIDRVFRIVIEMSVSYLDLPMCHPNIFHQRLVLIHFKRKCATFRLTGLELLDLHPFWQIYKVDNRTFKWSDSRLVDWGWYLQDGGWVCHLWGRDLVPGLDAKIKIRLDGCLSISGTNKNIKSSSPVECHQQPRNTDFRFIINKSSWREY